MTAMYMEKIIQKFEKFYVQFDTGRKRINSTSVEEVPITVQEKSSGCFLNLQRTKK